MESDYSKPFVSPTRVDACYIIESDQRTWTLAVTKALQGPLTTRWTHVGQEHPPLRLLPSFFRCVGLNLLEQTTILFEVVTQIDKARKLQSCTASIKELSKSSILVFGLCFNIFQMPFLQFQMPLTLRRLGAFFLFPFLHFQAHSKAFYAYRNLYVDWEIIVRTWRCM